jgi:ribulose-5-phosphate 4-epimerase/fuculose-1-phosphate aldolase
LRNHGLATMGATVADAFLAMYQFESACAIQISAQAGGELVHVNPQIMQNMPAVIQAVTKGQGAGIVWPALLRKLDRLDPGYKS